MYTQPDHPWHIIDPTRDLPLPADIPGPVDVVLDTDTYNEVDDQFALVYSLLTPDRINLEAVHAAPFHNKRSDGPADGMEKSYAEIQRVLERMHWDKPLPVHRGSTSYLPGPDTPVESDAARDLVERAMRERERPLHVIAIGAITNVASALLLEPALVERCNVVWLGGNYPYWPTNREFNMNGDVIAAQVVFDSGVPLYVVPALGVSSHLTTTREELAAYLDREDPLSRFLYERYAAYGPAEGVWSKEIWDIGGIAWVVLPDSVTSFEIPTPRIAPDGSYIPDPRRHLSRFAYRLNRDAIYRDLFDRLAR